MTTATRMLLLGLITLAGGALRFVDLGDHSLWLDETISVHASRRLGLALTSVAHPPLFYVALHLWSRLFGQSDAALRALAALAGTLAVPAVFLLARRAFGRDAVALAAALLLAVMPEAIWHSRQVRHYSLWPVFVLLALWALLAQRARRPPFAATLLYWAATALAMATHYYTAFYALALALAAWLLIGERPLAKRRDEARRWLVLHLPLLVVPLGLALHRWSTWGTVRIEAAFTGSARARILPDLGSLIFFRPWIHPVPPRTALLQGALVAAALALAIVLAWRDRRADRPTVWALAVALWLPFLLIELLPVRGHARLFAPTLPIATVWLAYLAAAPAPSRAGAAARAAAVAVGLAALAPYWRPVYAVELEPWRSVCADIAAEEVPSSVVLVNEPYMERPLRRCYAARAPVVRFPSRRSGVRRATVRDFVAAYDEVWLIYSHAWRTDPQRTGLAKVQATHRLVARRTYGPLIDVFRLRRIPR